MDILSPNFMHLKACSHAYTDTQQQQWQKQQGTTMSMFLLFDTGTSCMLDLILSIKHAHLPLPVGSDPIRCGPQSPTTPPVGGPPVQT
eukprot:scaffold158252_cov29-Tisochrysis_lutea.AAC.1